MEKKEFWVEFTRKDKKQKEVTIRNFLLKNSDSVRLTRFIWRENFWKKTGHDEDSFFIKCIDSLKSSFVKKTKSTKRFNDVEQGKKKAEHYFFRTGEKVKQLLEKETLFFYPPINKDCSFYGFEDPTFYKKGAMVGGVISHESLTFLYLGEKDSRYFKSKNIGFLGN